MRLKWALMVVIVAGAFFAGGWLLRRARTTPPPIPSIGPATSRQAGTDLFSGVFQTIKAHAVDSLGDQTIYQLATAGVLAELGDPYALVVPGSDSGSVPAFGEPPVQGLYLDQTEGYVEVVGVIPGSPAATAGVRPGDAVLAVDRATVERQRADEVARMIGGSPGSTVKLRLGRESAAGGASVTRGEVPALIPIVVDGLDPGVARLKFSRLDSASAAAAGAALDSLASSSRAVIIDLRGSVEGTFAGALALAERLLEPGATIAITRSRLGADSIVYLDREPDAHARLAVVVLVDRSTAGPAELLAGTLQDHDRAVVVGEATFGRGASQSLFPLGNGSSLRLTTAVWVTPSGRVIQRFPVPEAPDGTAPDSAVARPKFTTQGGRTVLGGGGIVPDREVPAGAEPSGAADPALALARSLIQRSKDRKGLLTVAAIP